jgi:hypothetical protein
MSLATHVLVASAARVRGLWAGTAGRRVAVAGTARPEGCARLCLRGAGRGLLGRLVWMERLACGSCWKAGSGVSGAQSEVAVAVLVLGVG